MIRIVKEAVSGGVNMVQVRAHELDDHELTRLAIEVVEAVESLATVVVNGPSDAAVRSGASGVHYRESRNIDLQELPSGAIAGQSVHSIESALAAERAGADYVIVGTVFPSESHPDGATGGVDLVASVAGVLGIPVIGIGGITVSNAVEVMQAGGAGVAVIGAIINAKDPAGAARALKQAIEVD